MNELNSDELQIWPIHLTVSDSEVSTLAALLSQDEKERAARFRFEKDRRAFTVCRASLRLALRHYLGHPANSFAFTYSTQRKPALASQTDLRFNVSHSQDLAILAFTPVRELGVDVECVRHIPEIVGIARRFFSPEEFIEITSLPSSEQTEAFFRCWTRKEAFIKATGDGLSAPLDQFQVTLGSQSPSRFVHIHHDSEEAAQWTLQNLPLQPPYVGAVAYRAPARKLQIMNTIELLSLNASHQHL